LEVQFEEDLALAQSARSPARACSSSVRQLLLSFVRFRLPQPVLQPTRHSCNMYVYLLAAPTPDNPLISRLSTLVYRPCFFLPPSFFLLFRLPPAFFLLPPATCLLPSSPAPRAHHRHHITRRSQNHHPLLSCPVLCCALGEYEPSDDDEVEEIEEVSDFLRQLHVGHHKDKHHEREDTAQDGA